MKKPLDIVMLNNNDINNLLLFSFFNVLLINWCDCVYVTKKNIKDFCVSLIFSEERSVSVNVLNVLTAKECQPNNKKILTVCLHVYPRPTGKQTNFFLLLKLSKILYLILSLFEIKMKSLGGLHQLICIFESTSVTVNHHFVGDHFK